MMENFFQFFVALTSHWLELLGGAFLITIIGIIERFRSRDVSFKTYGVLMLVLLLYGCFAVWKEQRDKAATATVAAEEWKLKFEQTDVERVKVQAKLDTAEAKLDDFRDKLRDAANARPIEVRVPQLASVTEPAVTEGLRISQRRVPSRRNDAPYATEITVQVASSIQQMALRITCDGPIEEGTYNVVGQGIYTKTRTGISGRDHNQYFVSFESPPVTPQNPLIIMLMSKAAIKVTQVDRVPYKW